MDMDPPEHTRLRRLIARAFTVRRVEQLRSRTEDVASELLDRMTAADQPADLVAGLAMPLPGTMICELLGVPYADRAAFGTWVETFVSTTGLTGEQKRTYVESLRDYVATMVARRRRDPSDDLLSALVQAHDEGDRLAEDEVIGLVTILLAAGYETVATQITNFVLTLLQHPDQWRLLHDRSDQSNCIPDAVEELLRYIPLPATEAVLPRYATADVTLGGGTVRAGEAILVSKYAANRDPLVFADPERLDLSRPPGAHLAFGHGVHHCVGAALARMELQVALGSLLTRLPGLRLAVAEADLQWKTGLAVRGPLALPVAW